MAAKRKAISKKVRFEVFKRDSFTCQYCGKAAPDVILHVDHIHPVSKGGDNSILNLITSCAGCNGGKGARPIDDQAALAKQRQQLAEINEKREQLQLMVQWKTELESLGDQEVEAAANWFTRSVNCVSAPNDTGKRTLKRLIRKHGLKRVMDAIEAAADRHLFYGDDGDPTSASIRIAFDRLESICNYAAIPQDVQDQKYIFGILRNRVDLSDRELASDVVESIKGVTALVGIPEARAFAKTVDDIEDWWNFVAVKEYEHATAGDHNA